MSNWLRVVATSFRVQITEAITSETALFTTTLQPVLFALLSVGLYRYGGKPDLSLYAIIGSSLIGMWNANLWTSGFIITNERQNNTLELLLGTPTSLMTVLFGKSLSNAILSVFAIFITFLTGALALRVPVGIADPLGFLLALALTVLALTTLGLIFGTFFLLMRRAGRMAQVFNYPIFILSGLTFPITLLPLWTRPLSSILAPTWGNQAMGQAAGLLDGSFWTGIAWLGGLAALYYFIGLGLYRWIERIARVQGGLNLF